MERIVEVKPLNNYILWVRFADEFSAELDIKPFIKGGISDALLNKDYFKRVKIDDFNGISWENGFDFCPNFLKEYIVKLNKKSA